jgi:hypothetical protein
MQIYRNSITDSSPVRDRGLRPITKWLMSVLKASFRHSLAILLLFLSLTRKIALYEQGYGEIAPQTIVITNDEGLTSFVYELIIF